MPAVQLVHRRKHLLPFQLGGRHLILRFVVLAFLGWRLLFDLFRRLFDEEFFDFEVELRNLLNVTLQDGCVELEADVLILELLDDVRHLFIDADYFLPGLERCCRLDVLLDTHVAETKDHPLNRVHETDNQVA